MIEAYPLCWPSGQPRTPTRVEGPYRVTMNQAMDELQDELRKLGGTDLVISTNVPTRRDGLPYANTRSPEDPGVAVYWARNGRDFVIACDTYSTVRANLRAIGLTLHHLRRLEQAAPEFLADKAFEGFARLPAFAGHDGRRPWRDVLELPHNYYASESEVRSKYTQLARERHPDRGGSQADMSELNRAYREALAEVSA